MRVYSKLTQDMNVIYTWLLNIAALYPETNNKEQNVMAN